MARLVTLLIRLLGFSTQRGKSKPLVFKFIQFHSGADVTAGSNVPPRGDLI